MLSRSVAHCVRRGVSQLLPVSSAFPAPSTPLHTTRNFTSDASDVIDDDEGIDPRAMILRDLKMIHQPLEQTDPELFSIITGEQRRLRDSIILIPSENYTSQSVLDALGSIMQNKYSEGYPGARYYGGNQWIDNSERLCQKRALEAYKLDPEEWGVNVQPLSGSPANFEVYTAVLKPHDRILSLDLPHGGHLSHGYQIPSKKISAVSTYFEVLPYRLDPVTERVDYDKMEELATLYRPKLLVGGASAYSRYWDFERMSNLAKSINAYFMFDMAHISGLVAAGVHPSPFEYADIVTTTTHKSLRGPRGAMIFYRKGVRNTNKKTGEQEMYELESLINASVFPGHQGGPHNHTITALATALKQAQSKEFIEYQRRVVANSIQLCSDLNMKYNFDIVSGGTDNHLSLIKTSSSKGVNGAQLERICELANITLNKNTVPGDRSAMNPGGIRIGSPAMTSRGCIQSDFSEIASFIHHATEIAIEIQKGLGEKNKKLKDFNAYIESNDKINTEINTLKHAVSDFSKSFPVPGVERDLLKSL